MVLVNIVSDAFVWRPQACDNDELRLQAFRLVQAMLFQCVLHPKRLDPFQAAEAWHLRVKRGMSWLQVRTQVHAVAGARPGQRAVEDAATRVAAQRYLPEFQRICVVKAMYANCGRTPLLSPAQKQAVVAFVKRWCSKCFCTANCIIQELKLICKNKTIHRALNEAGYHWRPVPEGGKLTDAHPPSERRSSTLTSTNRLHGGAGTWAWCWMALPSRVPRRR